MHGINSIDGNIASHWRKSPITLIDRPLCPPLELVPQEISYIFQFFIVLSCTLWIALAGFRSARGLIVFFSTKCRYADTNASHCSH